MSNSTVEIRLSKREQIAQFFAERIGMEYGTSHLHDLFGTAFRSRVSEINRDPQALITIHNRTHVTDKGEQSIYWSELRKPASLQEELFT